MKICITFFISLMFSMFVWGEETNELYVTENSPMDVIRGKSLFETKKTRESLPAKDFPEGNWGTPAFGLQVSLRLSKSVYTNGEQVSAVVLVRNVTNSAVSYPYSNFGDGDDPILLVVVTETGQTLERPPRTVISSGVGARLFPLTQRKYQEHIGAYHLTNGTYFVHASAPIVFETQVNGKPRLEWHEVNSAAVPIKVE